MFEDINEPLAAPIKILFVKGGICPEASLESSLEVVTRCHSFDKYMNHIASSVINKRSRVKILKLAQT